jgi:signal transduction histidine kinase
MNKLLLMKVEELTLYLIKQERDKKKLEERLSKIELMIRSDI